MISVTELGMVKEARLIQSPKAAFSIDIILSGIITEVRLLQPLKAFQSMEVNPVKYCSSSNVCMDESLKYVDKLFTAAASAYDTVPLPFVSKLAIQISATDASANVI